MEMTELPTEELTKQAAGLVGFQRRYEQVAKQMRLILEKNEVASWSKKYYGRVIDACVWAENRHALFIFSGDVGTGKTATAGCIANRLCQDTGREGRLLKVGSDIRGTGLHGDMSRQIGAAFKALAEQAGKRRLAFLLVDEADAIATERSTEQMHQEEKAGVNFLIQGLDGIRAKDGRAAAFLCTNRAGILDAAIVRRAICRMLFKRPTKEEAEELLRRDLAGTEISEETIKRLAAKTISANGENKAGYTFSDYRQRWLPAAIARAYPGGRLTPEILEETAEEIVATPEVR